MAPPKRELAIALSGGGARAAYQAGVLRCLARHFPDVSFPLITGVSAGAINAAFLASRPGPLEESAEDLAEVWKSISPENIFRAGGFSLGGMALRWALSLISGGSPAAPRVRGLLDTTPLYQLLRRTLADQDGSISGIHRNLDNGRLRAVAITAINYATGQTVTWVQGSDIETWERPNRRSEKTVITPLHVMASSALPLAFPAVKVGGSWFGDGGMRLATPLAPAVHLGAGRILAISTRYNRSFHEADQPEVTGYPPPAQILGHLMRAIFLDALDQDALLLERFNSLLTKLPPEKRDGLRPIDLVVLRPSIDLGKLAGDYEAKLPGVFRFMVRGLGTRETKSPDFLSLLMFEPNYIAKLIEMGERDAETRLDALSTLIG